MSESENWAPKRIWLQREQGDMGSHTWCEDSVGTDMIEEVGYVRADVAQEVLEAARQALTEMCYVASPRHSFTDAVDALDAAISKAKEA